jgi:hypothetical protein
MSTIYEVWALGYKADGSVTDIDIHLGEFGTAEKAIKHAQKFYDIECITGKPDHPDYNPIYDFYPDEGDYIVVVVEECLEFEPEDEFDPEEGYVECIKLLYEYRLPLVGEPIAET